MIKKEFKKIWENKLLFVTVIVVSILPILYASVFLKSIWDPYGHMNELPVAVVNEDKSVDFQGKSLSVGNELVSNLKKNNDLDWNFVSQNEAKQGLKDRKYYMIVTIPQDFSKNAATVLDSNPEKMNLKYETNAGVNFLGEVVSDNAMKQLKAQVSEKVTKSYATAIISTIKELGSGMETAATGAGKLNDGAGQLNTGVTTLSENVPALADGVSQLANGSATLANGVSQYTNGVAQVANGGNQLNAGMGQLTGQLPVLTNGLGQLGTGANKLATGVTQYTNGVAQVANGNQQLAQQLPTLIEGINKLSTGANALSTSLNQINLSDENKNQLLQYVNGVQAYLTQVNGALQGIDLSKLANLGQLATALSSVETNLTTMGNDLTTIQNGLKTAVGQDVQSNTVAVVTALAKSGVNLTPEQQQAIGGALATNAQTSHVLALVTPNLTEAGQNLQAVAGTLTAAKSQMGNIDPNALAGLGSLKTSTSQLAGVTNNATAGLTQVVNGLATVKNQAGPGAAQLAGGLNELNKNTPALAAAVNQLAAGGAKLNENAAQLTSGANQLAGGLATVNEKTPALTNGVTQLATGISTLANGANQLNSKSGELNDGTAKLATGLTTLNGKIPDLSSGVMKLKDGTSQLAGGTNELATKLKEGSDRIGAISLGDKNAEMIANPSKETQSKYSSVPNYGHALAPYFMSVSLFVGALVFNFVYPIRKIADRQHASAGKWYLSKVTVGGIVATAMALIIGVVMQLIGLDVSNQAQFFAMLLVNAWVNMFLIMFLAMSFDNPGRFIAVLLLVLQLGSAGGVFPMEITSKFYNVLHPYIPMTYAIYGLRQAISTGLGNDVYTSSLLILFVLVIVLLALLRVSMGVLFKRGFAGYSQLHNTQKLFDDDYANKKEKYTIW